MFLLVRCRRSSSIESAMLNHHVCTVAQSPVIPKGQMDVLVLSDNKMTSLCCCALSWATSTLHPPPLSSEVKVQRLCEVVWRLETDSAFIFHYILIYSYMHTYMCTFIILFICFMYVTKHWIFVFIYIVLFIYSAPNVSVWKSVTNTGSSYPDNIWNIRYMDTGFI